MKNCLKSSWKCSVLSPHLHRFGVWDSFFWIQSKQSRLTSFTAWALLCFPFESPFGASNEDAHPISVERAQGSVGPYRGILEWIYVKIWSFAFTSSVTNAVFLRGSLAEYFFLEKSLQASGRLTSQYVLDICFEDIWRPCSESKSAQIQRCHGCSRKCPCNATSLSMNSRTEPSKTAFWLSLFGLQVQWCLPFKSGVSSGCRA